MFFVGPLRQAAGMVCPGARPFGSWAAREDLLKDQVSYFLEVLVTPLVLILANYALSMFKIFMSPCIHLYVHLNVFGPKKEARIC